MDLEPVQEKDIGELIDHRKTQVAEFLIYAWNQKTISRKTFEKLRKKLFDSNYTKRLKKLYLAARMEQAAEKLLENIGETPIN